MKTLFCPALLSLGAIFVGVAAILAALREGYHDEDIEIWEDEESR